MPSTESTLSRPVPRLRFTAKLILQGNPSLPCALLAVAMFVALGASEAGYDATAWYPGALLILALLVVAVVAFGDAPPPGKPIVVAVAALAAFAIWSYLSISWAENEARALEGANHAAFYALALALFAIWPFDARGARMLLATYGLGLAGVGLVELIKANGAADPLDYFIDVRFSEPAGYINANVALWMLGLFACLSTACARESHLALRGLALGAAGLLGSLALLGQSRGWVLAAPLALVLWIALSPQRVRALVPTLAVLAGVAAIAGPILAVHDDFSARGVDALLSDATTAILVLTVVLIAAGTAIALVDRRMTPGESTLRRLRAGTAIATGLALVAALVAFTAVRGNPVSEVGDLWEDFKGGGEQAQVGSSRFTTAGTNRYDFWTVAVEQFRGHPVRGIGSENFQEAYLREGNSGEQPRYPHSLELGVLSQTGLVGAILLLAAFGAALVGGALTLRSGRRPLAAAAAACMATFGYWALHASVDWFWEFPGLTAPAIAMLGMAAALAPRAGDPRRIAPGGLKGIALGALAAAVGLALMAPWRAEVETGRATSDWRNGIQAAYDRLDRARALNPLSPEPDSAAGSIAVFADDLDEARRRFEAVLERSPRNSFALLQLGLIESALDRRATAIRLIERAQVERPRDEIVREVLADLRAGRRVTPSSVNRRIAARVRLRHR